MTEKEKAAAGYLYNANYDEDIIAEIAACTQLCYEYNNIPPAAAEARDAKLREIIRDVGSNALVMSPFWCDYGNVKMGDFFFSNHNLVLTDGARITFGDHVFIAPNVCITTAEHAIDAEQRSAGLEVAYLVTVGNNVWIGAGTTILAGVTIGDNTVIGAGSVVTRSVPSNVIAVGVPCRVLREITEEDKKKYPMYIG